MISVTMSLTTGKGYNMAGFLQVKPTLNQVINEETAADYFSYLKLLAETQFEWTGLPPSVSARYLERRLFEDGRALFFKDPDMGYLALGCTRNGGLNVYNEATQYCAHGTTYTANYDADNCVLIRNNYDEESTRVMAILYAGRLYEAERTMDINVKAQKTPKFLAGTEKQRLTLLNIWKQWTGNEPLILVDKNMDPDSLRSIDMTAPYVSDKLMIYKHNVLNDYCTRLGLNNANTDKKERLITDEVDANNQLITLSLNIRLAPRQDACKLINALYGLNVSVDIRKNMIPEPIEIKAPETSEGDESNDE